MAADLQASRWRRARRVFGTWPIDWTTVGLLSIPIVFFAVMVWTHRWMADDGFINVHVVQQILAGHGPVFNAGERVEAATSPLWILWLVVGKVVFFWLPIEWVAVIGGIAMRIGGLVLAVIAAPRAYHTRRLLPIGLVVFVVVPPAASYASSRVYVADELGLANPIGSRLRLSKDARARHEKYLPLSWIVAMFADPAAPIPKSLSAADVSAARRALNCPEIARLLERARAPLSVSRAWTNFSQAITDFSLRIDPDPKVDASRCARK